MLQSFIFFAITEIIFFLYLLLTHFFEKRNREKSGRFYEIFGYSQYPQEKVNKVLSKISEDFSEIAVIQNMILNIIKVRTKNDVARIKIVEELRERFGERIGEDLFSIEDFSRVAREKSSDLRKNFWEAYKVAKEKGFVVVKSIRGYENELKKVEDSLNYEKKLEKFFSPNVDKLLISFLLLNLFFNFFFFVIKEDLHLIITIKIIISSFMSVISTIFSIGVYKFIKSLSPSK